MQRQMKMQMPSQNLLTHPYLRNPETHNEIHRMWCILVVFVVYSSVFWSYFSVLIRIPLYSISNIVFNFWVFNPPTTNTNTCVFRVYSDVFWRLPNLHFFRRLSECIPRSSKLGLQTLLLFSSCHHLFFISYSVVFHVYLTCISMYFAGIQRIHRKQTGRKIRLKYV